MRLDKNMWIRLNRVDEESKILIDCRNIFNCDVISPTYKLANTLGVKKGLVFSIDNLFFALFFLSDLIEFSQTSALIQTPKYLYQVFDKEVRCDFQILEFCMSNEVPVFDGYDWVRDDFISFENSISENYLSGKGLILFDCIGYIIVNVELRKS